MRRTFQDLARQAQVHDFVTRGISGHATVAMQEHYNSTVDGEETREGLSRILLRAGFGTAGGAPRGYPGGYPTGGAGPGPN